MIKALLLAASASVAIASPAFAQDYRFDFSGTVIPATTPPTVTPQGISGYLTYLDNMAPADGNVVTNMGQASLSTNLYNLMFTSYTATLSDQVFSFGGTATTGETLALRLTSNDGGLYSGAFALTNAPTTAVGQISGTFATPTNPTPSVPEPAAWLLMIVGIGAVGVALRRARVTTQVSYS